MKVKDCMCEDVCTIKPESTLREVAKMMSEKHIGCMPVCDNNNCVCGIITDRDLVLRGIACNKDINNTKVSDIMTCNVCSCFETDDITNAETKMGQKQIRRLPVCDENNKIVGILTIGDLANKKVNKEELSTTLEDICNCNGNQNNM